MKGLLLLFILLLFYGNTYSQSRIKIVTGLSSSFSKEVISNTASQTYGALGFDLGARYHERKWSLDLSLAYQFSSNVDYYAHADSIALVGKYYKQYDSDGNKIDDYSSLLRSHFIGVNLKYMYRERDKKFRPFVQLSALTEVGTNYKNGYLSNESFIPMTRPSETGYFPNPYRSTLYYSTPLVGSTVIGCDIRIIENLNLTVGIGYGFRIMKTKEASWSAEDNLDEIAKDIPTVNISSHMIDFKVGFSYVFLSNKTFTLTPPPF